MIVKINNYPITAQFGSVDAVHMTPHQGIDVGLPMQTPIASVGDGVVQAICDEGTRSFGLSVKVHMTNGADVIYGHLSETKVKVGQVVHHGDLLALSGSSGHSTGPHLHLQVMNHGHAIDPTPYLHTLFGIVPADSIQLATDIFKHAADSLIRGIGLY